MPGVEKLPFELQIIFWLMFLFIGTLCSLIVYWVKRYIDAQDERLANHEMKLSRISSDLSNSTLEVKSVSLSMKVELKNFENEIDKTILGFRDEIHLMSRDLSTAQTRLIVLNEGSDKLFKTNDALITVMKSETKKLDEAVQKISAIDATQTKIITIIQKLSDRLIKISSKPE